MEVRGSRCLPLFFSFLQTWKCSLHDSTGERLGMKDHFGDTAILSLVYVEQTPGRIQFSKGPLKRFDAGFILIGREGGNLLNLQPDRVEAAVELIRFFGRGGSQSASSGDLAQ